MADAPIKKDLTPKKGENIEKTWYSPRRVKEAWRYFIKYLDKTLKNCEIIYGDNTGYDLSQHKIFIKKKKCFSKIYFLSAILEMIIMALVPEAKKVKYKEQDHILIKMEDLELMAGRFAFKIYPHYYQSSSSDAWIEHIKDRHLVKKDRHAPLLSRDELSFMYYDKRLPVSEIAKLVNKNIKTVLHWMDEYKLPRTNRTRTKYVDPNKLYDLYYVQDFTLKQIDDILDLQPGAAANLMRQYNMPPRTRDFTTPGINTKIKAFKSSLRKKVRRNPYYIKVIEEFLVQAKEDPDFYNVTKENH